MAILIDGYNLLHAAGIIPRGVGRGTLERARQALINWLVSTLEPDQVRETTVVFDAADPPPGRPRQFDHQGLTVFFSVDHENADAMLEELIRQCNVPKRLVVVSSDHRVQRAARRRRSTAIDSDAWYFGLRERRNSPAIEPQVEAKPVAPLSAAEVQHWLEEFGPLLDDLDQLKSPAAPTRPGRVPADERPGRPSEHAGADEASASTDKKTRAATDKAETDKAGADEPTDAEMANPFPPGYGEDLLRPGADLDE